MSNNKTCSDCEQSAKEALRWKKLLKKKLLVIQYDWVVKKTSIGILRLCKRPEPWEILRINENELILQMFMATSYSDGKTTRNLLENSRHPIFVEDDRIIEILQSSICSVIEITD
ncbi:MAG: hypothetical protein KAQ64_02390 [Candidatus Pacebacteria bacterium]|nr:hypothetical protein [Candidatus Paceibacterota bacterium]